jgi:hypothetical protein
VIHHRAGGTPRPALNLSSAWVGGLLASLVLAALLPGGLEAQTGGAVSEDQAQTVPSSAASLMVDPPRGASAIARATRIHEAPVIDGVLDEAMWAEIEPITDFVQRDPVDGGVPSERTEVRIAYDEDYLYFGLIMYDSEPEGIRAHVLQRGGMIGLDDHIVIGLDTFKDRRNGYIFEMNSFGTQDDALFTDEQIQDWNWEGVYHSEARITEYGWTLEVAIPFTTIRFPREEVLEMGILFYRSIRRKNETVFWPHLPATYRGRYAQSSQYGTLIGLEGVVPGRNLEIKPYLLAGAQKSGSVAPTNRVQDVGLDVKYSLTSSLTMDLTWNTDFAQVEADNVQVNLDRFSLFFPEKREFFRERSGLFEFGDSGATQLFFSRRIGLNNPIIGGGRLTGQAGRFTIGALSLQTDDEEGLAGANNSVARVRADLGERTSVGGLVTNLQRSGFASRGAGVDAQLRFFGSSSLDLWASRIWDPSVQQLDDARPAGSERGPASGLGAGAATLVLRNATYGMELGYTNIGQDFLPALGFVRRRDQVRREAELSYTPRFETHPLFRQLTLEVGAFEIDGQDGRRQSGNQEFDAGLSFQTGDNAGIGVDRSFERLDVPFEIQPGTVIPVGDYTFATVGANFRTNRSRRMFANANLGIGDFYHGTRTQLGGGFGFKVSPHLSLEPGVRHNSVSLPVANGDFTTNVVELSVKGAANRRLFADLLLQYDDVSERVQTNLRLNWIHTPGSNLFVVLDTGYNAGDLLNPRDSRWERRTGLVKITYLWAL